MTDLTVRFNSVLYVRIARPGSHLLQAACADRVQRSAIYLPLAEHDGLQPEMLDGLERLELVALDDVDRVAVSAEWNQALFRLINGLQAGGQMS